MFLKWRRRKTKLNDILQKATTPKAYSTYACIGVVVTAVVTAICMHKHDEAKREIADDVEMTREEVIDEIKQVGSDFTPAIASAIVTMLLIKKADREWMNLNGVASTGYMIATNRLDRYRSAMPSVAAAEVLHGFAKKPPDDGKQWFCIKGFTPDDQVIYFQSTPYDVILAEYMLNKIFQIKGSASAEEFLKYLDVEPWEKDDDNSDRFFGWDMASMFEDQGLNYAWIDFDHRVYTDPESGQQVTEISYIWEPEFTKRGEPYGLSPCE